MKRATIAYIPSSHLDLYWLGNYKTCLERGAEVIRGYLQRCLEAPEETFLLETVVFADYFLKKHPEFRADFLRLVREGRLEVGSAYVDRAETLVAGESLIRNVQIGKRWCRQELGIDNPLVTHPDLPSLTSQIPQIYSQLGLKYYVTSRKVYRHGRIWRYRAPDGSRILMLNWPRHYVFPLMDASDVAPEVLRTLWVPPLDIEETLKGFPLGWVAASGSAGDLAGRETFHERYRQNLEDYVQAYRQKYPDFDFIYSIPSKIMAPYQDTPGLPEHSGEVPSVWGVSAAEEIDIFARDRLLETRLLTAESLAVVANFLGLAWRPPSAERWQGTFYEGAFFGRKDPVPAGQELTELWRMHIFTQDHNGGGQEGALSTFQKRTIQQRALGYVDEILNFSLDQIAARLPGDGARLVLFNPHGQEWSGPLEVTIPEEERQAGEWADARGNLIPSQELERRDGLVTLQLALPPLPALGYLACSLAPAGPVPAAASVAVRREPGRLILASERLEAAVDLRSGALTRFFDRQRGQDWGDARLGSLCSITESGNDVSLRIDSSLPPALETCFNVELLDTGPLFTRVRIYKRLLRCEVEETLTLWGGEARLDLEVRIFWWGQKRQQLRLALSGAAAPEAVTYGVPFYGAGWTETVEGCGPWNSDEIAIEDQMSYREAHGWVHLAGVNGGLTICSNQSGYHRGADGLDAVLLRTSPSCGDSRLFFENTGEHVFNFSFYPGEQDWKTAGSPRLAAFLLKPPAYRLAQAGGDGLIPARMSFLKIEEEAFALSCLYPGERPGTVAARVWDMSGHGGVAKLTGPLCAGRAVAANFMEEEGQPLERSAGALQMDIPAWGIRTVVLKP